MLTLALAGESPTCILHEGIQPRNTRDRSITRSSCKSCVFEKQPTTSTGKQYTYQQHCYSEREGVETIWSTVLYQSWRQCKERLDFTIDYNANPTVLAFPSKKVPIMEGVTAPRHPRVVCVLHIEVIFQGNFHPRLYPAQQPQSPCRRLWSSSIAGVTTAVVVPTKVSDNAGSNPLECTLNSCSWGFFLCV